MSDTLFDFFEDADMQQMQEEEKKKKSTETKKETVSSVKKTKKETVNIPCVVYFYTIRYDITLEHTNGVEKVDTDVIRQLISEDQPQLTKENTLVKVDEATGNVYVANKMASKGGLLNSVDASMNDFYERLAYGLYKVRGSNGLFRTIVSPLGTCISKQSDLDQREGDFSCLIELEDKFIMALPKIGSNILEQFLSVSLKELHVEFYADLFYDVMGGFYFLFVPEQQKEKYTVDAYTSEKFFSSNFIHVADIHSHHTLNCSFSPKDDCDDIKPLLHFCFYNVDPVSLEHSCDVRMGTGRKGRFVPVTLDTITDWND